MFRTFFTSLGLALFTALPAAALELSCLFETECLEQEACGPSQFSLELDDEAKTVETEFATLSIVAIRDQDGLVTAFLDGAGATYLLTVANTAARLSVHMSDGPMIASYLGICEGVDDGSD